MKWNIIHAIDIHIYDLTEPTEYLELSPKIVSVQFTTLFLISNGDFKLSWDPSVSIEIVFPRILWANCNRYDVWEIGSIFITDFNQSTLSRDLIGSTQWTWLDTYVNHFGWSFSMEITHFQVHSYVRSCAPSIFVSRFSMKPATICGWRTEEITSPMRLWPNWAIYRYVNFWVSSSFRSWKLKWEQWTCKIHYRQQGHALGAGI